MATESQVRAILARPLDHEWTLQGFGMLRCYLDNEGVERLNIWDPGSAVDEVSTVHDHPWDFDSQIFFGEMGNQRYVVSDHTHARTAEFNMQRLIAGIGGGLIGAPWRTNLALESFELHKSGDRYHQDAPELHESAPAAGTVTVITRRFHADRDTATVAWQRGGWVSAEPRAATQDEVMHFISLTYKWT